MGGGRAVRHHTATTEPIYRLAVLQPTHIYGRQLGSISIVLQRDFFFFLFFFFVAAAAEPCATTATTEAVEELCCGRARPWFREEAASAGSTTLSASPGATGLKGLRVGWPLCSLLTHGRHLGSISIVLQRDFFFFFGSSFFFIVAAVSDPV